MDSRTRPSPYGLGIRFAVREVQHEAKSRGVVVDSTKSWFLDEHWPHYRAVLSPVAIHHGYVFNSAAPDEENINERIHWSVLAKRTSRTTPPYNPPNLPKEILSEKVATITGEERHLLDGSSDQAPSASEQIRDPPATS